MRKNLSTVLGSDVVRQLIRVRHPMIMVDCVTAFDLDHLSAERYVSANEPAFQGHFPNLKLWPGVHTIEGLRQCCAIDEALAEIRRLGLLEDLRILNDRYQLRPHVDDERCSRVIAALEDLPEIGPTSTRLSVKLQAPVFAGCRIDYHIRRESADERRWEVRAEVGGKRVASGEISWKVLDT